MPLNQNRSRTNRDLVIVSLLGIITIVAVVFLGDEVFTGGAVAGSCFQSDLQLDYYVKGSAEYRSKRWEDTCSSDGIRLQQAYCKTSVKVSMTSSFQCPYGCADGVCLAPEANCGNGRLDYGEQCDDGHLLDGDGCSAVCSKEAGFSCHTISVCNADLGS